MKTSTRKKCTKCSGTLVIEWDYRGWYAVCLHCGKEHLLQEVQCHPRATYYGSASHA